MTTEIRLNEHGDETHDSWLLVRANRVHSTPPQRLFDSEVGHRKFVQVTVMRCTRKRELNRDWLHGTEVLLEMSMSQAQWGAFVSSFGEGSGVPATLSWLAGEGPVPAAHEELRFEESHREVLDSGTKVVAEIGDEYERVMAAFEGGGKRELREALRSLGFAIENAPKNMQFAAESLTKHVEAVVTKARADIEAMVLTAMERGELTAEPISVFQIESGKEAPDA